MASAVSALYSNNYITATGIIYANATTVWPLWVDTANQMNQTATSSVIYTQAIWANWYNAIATGGVTSAGQYYVGNLREAPMVETPAQIRERERIQENAQAEERKRKAADAVAEKLLLEHLGEDQRAQFQKTRYFEIITSKTKRRYRIKEGWAGNVQVLDPKGNVIEKLCIHPTQRVPFADNLLAQKLLLEADEDLFRKTANITKVA